MTIATATAPDFQVDQEVTLAEEYRAEPVNWYSMATLKAGTMGVITRVTVNKVLLRTLVEYRGNDETPASMWIEKHLLVPTDPNAPRPRKLGEVPEGAISPDDPGLKWLWDDASKFAKRMGYCSTYDEITGTLNIPGRLRDFNIKINLGGIEVAGKIEARTKAEAEKLFREKLKTAARKA